MKNLKLFTLSAIIISMLYGCGSTAIVSTPIENIDNIPLKVMPLSDEDMKKWGHLDLVTDTIPGMSVEKAYNEILKSRKGKTTIVAVIDTGIDVSHEDLDDVIWVNKDEVPNNGKDDDNNGYVDDIHGWNFLGDGYNEQLEFVRLIARGEKDHPRYDEAKAELASETQKFTQYKNQYDQIYEKFKEADEALKAHLQKEVYNDADLAEIKTESMQNHVGLMRFLFSNGFEDNLETRESLEEAISQIYDRLNYHLNVDFNGRKTGDDPYDFSQTNYGNPNVSPVKDSESHGTHVAGIIAAERYNGLGMNGVANNVKIMALRAVPNGDEYDKDIALAIRYAADNGAKVVNMSFGKYYSPDSDKVYEAIKYAASKDVLLISGAGNEGQNLDSKISYPNDVGKNGEEVADNFISVGALEHKYGSNMVADYSNYGKENVDVFAPGSDIYSTVPGNAYKPKGGTSMASPGVAGVAALIRSYYPSLSASQVKQILVQSGVTTTTKVVVGGDTNTIKSFDQLSKSGKMVNAYNALIMASQMAKAN